MFEGDILRETQPTTLLQIFYESMIHSEVIFKSVTGPDDTVSKPPGNIAGGYKFWAWFTLCKNALQSYLGEN